jgi:hypothetical protein
LAENQHQSFSMTTVIDPQVVKESVRVVSVLSFLFIIKKSVDEMKKREAPQA